MSLEFELYEDKRRKMRRLSFIKGSIITFIVIVVSMGFWNMDLLSYPHIAKYKVFGEIYDDPQRDIILAEIAENNDVYGLLLEINSPGGSVVGAEALYNSLEIVRKKKPVVVSIGEVGASAAYIAALSGDKIFARGNSLIGSIGVIVQYPDLSKLADFLGISMEVIKSGEVKGGVNFLEPINKQTLKNQERLVNDSFIWFKGLVSERRGLVGVKLDTVSKGQLFTGRMALDLGLIDAIGSSYQALEYFESQGKKFEGIATKDWSIKQNKNSLFIDFFGLSNLVTVGKKMQFMKSPMLFSIAG